MNYRPDIDGLRAIAILLVLFYHAGISWFPAGFIGVDIFFVISGFLITSIIHQGLNKQTFSFSAFYQRRLWRLQPVFVALLLVTMVMAYVFYLPDDLIEFSRSARKVSLFLANRFFAQTTTGYFAPNVDELPLLHTWSLAVEWQCYLILPIFIYLLYKVVRIERMKYVFFILTVFSLWLTFYLSSFSVGEHYYLLSSRVFEFLIGSCIALGFMPHLKTRIEVINVVASLALISILWIACQNEVMIGYPNVYAFVLSLATGFIIVLGVQYPQNIVTKSISNRLLVFIGLISYSLYVWHWVIFSFLSYQNVDRTAVVLTLAFLVIFILAVASWRFLEVPTRRLYRTKWNYSFLLLIALPVFVTHLNGYVVKRHHGFPQRFNDELVRIYQTLDEHQSVKRPLCVSDKVVDIPTDCFIGANAPETKKAFMFGDSYSNHYWRFIDELGKKANVSVLAHATSSCLTLPDIYLYDWWHFNNTIYQACYEQTKQYYALITQNHYDYVILAQIWRNYLSDKVINDLGDERSVAFAKERISTALDKAMRIILQSGATPILLKHTAVMETDFHKCFFKHIKQRKPYNANDCQFDLQISLEDKWFDDLFNTMQIKYPSLVVIDPKDIQCPNNHCYVAIDGIPVYRDVGHITDFASYQLGKQFLKTHTNPFQAGRQMNRTARTIY